MNNELTIVQKIHREFEFDLLNGGLSGDQIAEIRPVSMTATEFVNMVEHYRVRYPMNNFVTEKQIGDICRKYGLVLGSALNFTGDIPPHNARQAQQFRLHPDDARFRNTSFFRYYLREHNRERLTVGVCNELSGRIPYIEFKTDWFDQSPDDMNHVLPIGDIAVAIAQTDRREWYDLFLKFRVHGSEWVLNFKEVNVWSGELIADWRSGYVQGGIRKQCRVTLRLSTDSLDKVEHLDLNTNVQKCVVAPRQLFAQHAEHLEIQNGYRLRFRDTSPPSGINFVPFINDPILLQPIPGGYLVITKWGDESNLPEFANPLQN